MESSSGSSSGSGSGSGQELFRRLVADIRDRRNATVPGWHALDWLSSHQFCDSVAAIEGFCADVLASFPQDAHSSAVLKPDAASAAEFMCMKHEFVKQLQAMLERLSLFVHAPLDAALTERLLCCVASTVSRLVGDTVTDCDSVHRYMMHMAPKFSRLVRMDGDDKPVYAALVSATFEAYVAGTPLANYYRDVVQPRRDYPVLKYMRPIACALSHPGPVTMYDECALFVYENWGTYAYLQKMQNFAMRVDTELNDAPLQAPLQRLLDKLMPFVRDRELWMSVARDEVHMLAVGALRMAFVVLMSASFDNERDAHDGLARGLCDVVSCFPPLPVQLVVSCLEAVSRFVRDSMWDTLDHADVRGTPRMLEVPDLIAMLAPESPARMHFNEDGSLRRIQCTVDDVRIHLDDWYAQHSAASCFQLSSPQGGINSRALRRLRVLQEQLLSLGRATVAEEHAASSSASASASASGSASADAWLAGARLGDGTRIPKM